MNRALVANHETPGDIKDLQHQIMYIVNYQGGGE